MYSYCNS